MGAHSYEFLLGLGGILAIIVGSLSPTWSDAILRACLVYIGMAAVALWSIGQQTQFAHFLFSSYGLGQVIGAALVGLLGFGLRCSIAAGWRCIRR